MNGAEGPLFVRQSRFGNWDTVSETTAEDLTFPADILGDVVDSDCQTSIWEVEGQDSSDIDYLVPGLIPRSNSNFAEITLRFISGWRLDKLGLKKRKTIGTCLDDKLNKKSMHWIVEIPTVNEAIRFAKGLTYRQARMYNKDSVMRRFALSLQEQRLQIKNVNKELLVQLVKEGHLRGAPPTPVADAPVVAASLGEAEDSPRAARSLGP